MVLGGLLEPQPKDVQPSPGSGSQLHLGGKASNTRMKVKWDYFMFPLSCGGLRIIVFKAQSEALLVKLLVRGLAPRGEPWKEILKHKAD